MGLIVVPGDSDLETCREHIQRLQEVRRTGDGRRWAERRKGKHCLPLTVKKEKGSTKHDDDTFIYIRISEGCGLSQFSNWVWVLLPVDHSPLYSPMLPSSSLGLLPFTPLLQMLGMAGWLDAYMCIVVFVWLRVTQGGKKYLLTLENITVNQLLWQSTCQSILELLWNNTWELTVPRLTDLNLLFAFNEVQHSIAIWYNVWQQLFSFFFPHVSWNGSLVI